MKTKHNKRKKKHNKTKKKHLMKGNGKHINKYGKHTNKYGTPYTIKPVKKKYKGTKRVPSKSINHCYKLNSIYNKWELLHDKLFNDMNLTLKERIKLQDELAKQIIIYDLNITPNGNYKKYDEFISNIKSCNNINILNNLSSLLQQIQTADSIPFDVINNEIKTCKYNDSCQRKHPTHKLLYHNPNFFTLNLIEIINEKIKLLSI